MGDTSDDICMWFHFMTGVIIFGFRWKNPAMKAGLKSSESTNLRRSATRIRPSIRICHWWVGVGWPQRPWTCGAPAVTLEVMSESQNHPLIHSEASTKTGWWFLATPLKNMSHLGWWDSQYFWENKIDVPNHQPEKHGNRWKRRLNATWESTNIQHGHNAHWPADLSDLQGPDKVTPKSLLSPSPLVNATSRSHA